jgi:hypothetical protein
MIKQISISFTIETEEEAFKNNITYKKFVAQFESFINNFDYFTINDLKIEINET